MLGSGARSQRDAGGQYLGGHSGIPRLSKEVLTLGQRDTGGGCWPVGCHICLSEQVHRVDEVAVYFAPDLSDEAASLPAT